MLESIVSTVLNRILGDYFENFSSNNLTVGLWSGAASVENLKMTSTALKNIFDVPLKVRDGTLGKLIIKIPWTDLVNKPTIMKLEGLSIQAEVTEEIEYSDEDELKYKQYLLDTIESQREAKVIAQQAAASNNAQTEAYIDRMLRNLQVEISSITVDIHDKKLKTNFGFSLSSLTLQSTNNEWHVEPGLSLQDKSLPVYKIARMKHFGVYISPNDSPTEHVLEPLTITSRIQHKINATEDQEKGSMELLIEALCIKLTRYQFKFAARFFEKLERIRRKGRFAKYRPSSTVKGNAKAWWIFAFKTIRKQYDIDKKVQLFNKHYIQEYCICRQNYRQLYEQKVRGNAIDENIFTELERQLDLSTLIEIREAVKLKIRQKPSQGSWFGNWFGSRAQDLDEAYVITVEDKDRLQALIKDNEQIIAANKNKPGVIKYSMRISLPLLKIDLGNLLSIQYKDSIINLNSVPGSNSFGLEIQTEQFEVQNLTNTVRPIVSSRASENSSLFKMIFTSNPYDTNLEKIADHSIDVKSGGIDVRLDHSLLKDVQKFFKVPEEANLVEFSTALKHEYVQAYAQTRAGLFHIVSTRNIVLISLDIKAPRITIPGVNEEAIILNFGRLTIVSKKSMINRKNELNTLQEHTMKELESLAYACYDVNLTNLEIAVRRDNSRPQLPMDLNILMPLNISLKFERLESKVLSSDLPKYKSSGEIAVLKLDISNYRVITMSKIINYALSIWREPIKSDDVFTPLSSDTILPNAPLYLESDRVANLENPIELESLYILDKQLFGIKESTSDLFYDSRDADGSDTPISDTSRSQSTIASTLKAIIWMKIQTLHINVSNELGNGLRILFLKTGLLEINQHIRQHQNSIRGLCQSIQVEYNPDQPKEKLELLSSGTETGSAITFDLLEDRQIDATETDILINTAAFVCSIDPKCIGKIMSFYSFMVNASSDINVEEYVTQDEPAVINSNQVTKKMRNLVLNSSSAQINFLSNYKMVTTFLMTGTEICFNLAKSVTTIQLKVAEISLIDPNSPCPYNMVVYVENSKSTFFDMELKLFNLSTGECADVRNVNGRFHLRTGALKINFFYVFLDHVAFFYPNELLEALNNKFEIRTSIVKSSYLMTNIKPVVEEIAPRYLLDIEIKAPKIFFPESKSSSVGFEADLGVLLVNNSFHIYEDSLITMPEDKNKIPIKDLINVQLKDCRLMKITDLGDPRSSSIQILHQKLLNIDVVRNLSTDWFYNEPSMRIIFDVPDISMELSKTDLEIFWCVLYGNIIQRFSEIQFKRTSNEFESLRVTDQNGKIFYIPAVSYGGSSEEYSEDTVTASTLTTPDDFDLMSVHINLSHISVKIFTDSSHETELTQVKMSEISGRYNTQANQETTFKLSVNDVYLEDLRLDHVSDNVPVYLIQKQLDEEMDEIFSMNYFFVSNDEGRSKQIVSVKMQSVQVILILDFCVQLYDILCNSIPRPEETRSQNNKKTEIEKDSQHQSNFQFYLEMEKPHVLVVTDMKNFSSSVLKISSNVRLTYITSITEQNLEIFISDTEMTCVPFKWSFETDSVCYGQMVMEQVKVDLNIIFGNSKTFGKLKFAPFEIVLTPPVISTVLLAYQYLFGQNIQDNSSTTSVAWVPLDQEQILKSSDLSFLPNSVGSVDSISTSSTHAEEAEEFQCLQIDLPGLSIKFENHIFYGKIANTVRLPLLALRCQSKIDVSQWSSELKVKSSFQIAAEAFHESRSDYEVVIEPIETPYDDAKPNLFEVDITYIDYSKHSQSYLSECNDSNDFEFIEPLPKKQLLIETKNSFNVNICNETIHVLNHLQSAFNESLIDLTKTSSLTSTKTLSTVSFTDTKAPITVENKTDLDMVFTSSSLWKEFSHLEKHQTNASSPIRRQNVTNTSSPIHSFDPDEHMRTTSNIYNLSSQPLFFQLKTPPIGLLQTNQQIISISPKGFTERQVDVTSPVEMPIEIVSNTNASLRITLIVHVHGIAGVRKITIRSAFIIDNQLSFPLKLFCPLDPTSFFFVNDYETFGMNPTEIISAPMRILTHTGQLSIALADPSIEPSTKVLCYNSSSFASSRREDFTFRTNDGSLTTYYANAELKRVKFSNSLLFKAYLTIRPCFLIRNWLPFGIIVNLDNHIEDYNAGPGQMLSMIKAKSNPTLYIRFSFQGKEFESESLKIPLVRDSKDEITLLKVSQTLTRCQNNLFLRKKMVWNQFQSKLEIFAPHWIVNKTGLVLQYHLLGAIGQEEKTIMHLSDDPFMILAVKRSEMKISCMKSEKSEKIILNTVGHQGIIYCPPFQGKNSHRQSYCLGYDVSSTTFGLTSVVTISSFYYLINNTDQDIEVAEHTDSHNSSQYQWILVKQHSKTVFWPHQVGSMLIRIRFPKSNYISKSFPYDANDQGILLNMGSMAGVFAEVSNTDNECNVSFSPYFVGSSAFNLINLSGFDIYYKQKLDSDYSRLRPCNSLLYTWTNPVLSRELVIEAADYTVNTDDSRTSIAKRFNSSTSLNNVIIPEAGKNALVQKTLRVGSATIYVVPIFIGSQRSIILTQNENHVSLHKKMDKQVTEMDIHFKVKAITISLIDYVRRREISALHIIGTGVMWHMQIPGQKKWREMPSALALLAEQNIKARRKIPFRANDYAVDTHRMQMTKRSDGKVWSLSRSERSAIDIRYQMGKTDATLDVKVQSIQIDNCLRKHKWPVILAKLPREQTVVAKDVYEREMILIQVVWGTSADHNIKRYKKAYILIQEFFLKIDIDFVMNIMRALNAETETSYFGEAEIYRLFDEDMQFIRALHDSDLQNTRNNRISFFEKLHLSPLKFHFKFSLESEDEELTGTNTVIQLMKSLGLSIVTNGEVEFRLAYFDYSYHYFSNNELVAAIYRHYKFQIVQQLYKFIYGLEILGNPMKVAFDWGTGVKNLFYEPYHGMTQSGDEFLEGIRIGSNKFFSGVIGGTAGGLNKITHNIGSLAATVSFDKEYSDRRQRDVVNAPSGLKEGIFRGGEKFMSGVFGGITGIVKKPVQGAKDQGTSGFFKGIGKGLAGAVVKPLTGMVDLTSNTFAGIHNELETKISVQPFRKSRVVDESPLKPYNERLAHAQNILWQLDFEKSEYPSNSSTSFDDLSSSIPLGYAVTSQQRYIVIVTNRHIMLVDTRTALGRLNIEWIKYFSSNVRIQFGGAGAERMISDHIIQVRDHNGTKMAKFSLKSEFKQIQQAVRIAEKQGFTREEFDSLI